MQFLIICTTLLWTIQGALFATPSQIPESTIIESMSDEERVDYLLKATLATVENLKKIQTALQDFHAQEKICIQESIAKKNKGNDSLFELSKKSAELLDLIKASKLQPYFRRDFLNELESISKAYKSKILPSIKIQ